METTAPDTLYHYTTLSGIVGIATTKRLWATSIGHLNDATEFTYSHGMLRESLERESHGQPADVSAAIARLLGPLDSKSIQDSFTFSGTLGATYVTSLSQDGDQLSQWRAYCPGGGYALGFRTEALQTIASEQGFDLVPCSYDKTQHTNEAQTLARELIDLILKVPPAVLASIPANVKDVMGIEAHRHLDPIRRQMLDRIQRRAPLWKHPAFREEAEWRLVSREHQGVTKFRVGRTAIVPYIEIELDADGDGVVAVLSNTYVGPCPEPGLAVWSAMHLFNEKKIKRTTFTLSQVPYRQW